MEFEKDRNKMKLNYPTKTDNDPTLYLWTLGIGMGFVGLVFDLGCKLLSILSYLLKECMERVGVVSGADSEKLGRLEGKVVLISGASSGIGEGLARYFYLAGCKVILAARRRKELERVKYDLSQLKRGSRIIYMPTVLDLDISDTDSLPAKIGSLTETVDILINNAGALNEGMLLDTPMETDEQIMKTNYFGSLALTKIVIRSWMERGQPGHVVFINSILGKLATVNCSSYVASKHALQAFADCLRLEVPEVKVTSIYPGYVNTHLIVNAMSSSNGDMLDVFKRQIGNGYVVDYVCGRIFKAIVNEDEEMLIAQWFFRGAIFLRYFSPKMYFVCTKMYGRWLKSLR